MITMKTISIIVERSLKLVMTNKEILKRFEFDLEMGRFKAIYRDGFIYPFVFHTKENEKILCKILDRLGYKKQDSDSKEPNIFGISIKPCIKEYWHFDNHGVKIGSDTDMSDNEIPEYLLEYKIDKNLIK